MGLARSDDSGRDGPVVDPHLEDEVVEALLVDVRQDVLHLDGKINEYRQMLPLGLVVTLRRLGYTRSCHVRRAYRLDLDDVLVLVLVEDLRGTVNFYRANFHNT